MTTEYKCFKCGKKSTTKASEKTAVSCTNCGSRIFYKQRKAIKKVKAI